MTRWMGIMDIHVQEHPCTDERMQNILALTHACRHRTTSSQWCAHADIVQHPRSGARMQTSCNILAVAHASLKPCGSSSSQQGVSARWDGGVSRGCSQQG
eukprot:128458-Pelagomonas_calceolata.AAC.1